MHRTALHRLRHHRHLISVCMSLLICATLVIAGLWAGANAHASDDYLHPDEAFSLSAPTIDATGNITLRWTIAPGYYLYRDRIAVKATPEDVLPVLDLPQGKVKDDPNFGEMVVYYTSVTVNVTAPGARALDITWQGCADEGLCYPPQTQHITVDGLTHVNSHDHSAYHGKQTNTPDASTSLMSAVNASDSQISQFIGQRSLAWTIPLFFLIGIALAFTPCVLPMVPIVSSIVVGSSATPRRAFVLSLAFVLPMAVTYAALGAIAAVAGANLQAFLQNPWTLGLFGAIFVILALAMFGFFTLQLPAFLRDRLDGASRTKQGGTVTGVIVMGFLSALLVGPCMTAPLAGILLYIAQTGNVVSGTVLLFALGIGMGVPLLAIGTLGARYLPRPGPWMDIVKGAFGFLLLGTAIWMVERIVSEPASLALWGALFIGLALTLRHITATVRTGYRLLLLTCAVLFGLWGGAALLGAAMENGELARPLVLPAMTGAPGNQDNRELPFEIIRSTAELDAHLAAAKAANMPLVVDFSADWCVSCKKMERTVFPRPDVQQALSGVRRIRADVTASSAEEVALMRQYQVLGPPTILLFDAQGKELREHRIVGEFTGAELVRRIGNVQNAAHSTAHNS